MPRRACPLAASVALLVVLCALWAPTALAHPSPAPRETAPGGLESPVDIVPNPSADEAPARWVVRQDAARTAVPVLLVLVAVLLLGTGAACAPGATARVLLSLLIAVTAAESAVHSVHHLDDPGGAKECQVLTVTQQLHADTAPALPDGVPLAALRSDVVAVVLHGATQSVRRPDQGRAPPLPIA
jgi:hypothetical protein